MEEEKEDQESNAEEKLESNGTEAEDSPKEISLEDKVKELEDKILRSAAEIDPRTRMLSVIGQIPTSQPSGPGFPIKVGMFVNASIQGRVFNDIYVVPREKVRDNVVWVLNKEGLLSKREVAVLRYEKDKALVSKGFLAGDKILLTRLDVLVEGMKLQQKGN